MAAIDKNRSLLVTGRLSYGCTSLALDWPHGGTGMGLCGSIYWEPPAGVVRLTAEEDNATRELLYVGGDAVLGASLEQWDDAVAAAGNVGGVASVVWPSRLEVSGDVVLEWPGASGTGRTRRLPGELVPKVKLVFTADNPTHPSIILYSAAPLVEASEALRLSAIRPLSVPLLFVGTPDAQGRVAAQGRLSRLSL